jgi:hypothetical protein
MLLIQRLAADIISLNSPRVVCFVYFLSTDLPIFLRVRNFVIRSIFGAKLYSVYILISNEGRQILRRQNSSTLAAKRQYQITATNVSSLICASLT